MFNMTIKVEKNPLAKSLANNFSWNSVR